jgi:putative spermidine/putrescine transport system substrate-binding protein
MKKLILLYLAIIMISTSCSLGSDLFKSNDPEVKNWELIKSSAKNSTVTMALQHSNPMAVEWFKKNYATYLKSEYGMTLIVVEQTLAKTMEILEDDLRNELEIGRYDLIVFENGGFKRAAGRGLLYTPFTDKLPNMRTYVDRGNVEFKYKDGIEVNDSLAPYGRNQLYFAYDQDIFYETPATYDALLEYVKEYNNAFVYPDPRTSIVGELFVVGVAARAVDMDQLMTVEPNKEAVYAIIGNGLDFLNELEPYMYLKGAYYPTTAEEMDELFVEGELVFSMNLDFEHVTNKLKDYEYPEGSSSFVIQEGTMGLNEWIGIPYNAPNKSGAMAAVNALLSPEMQGSKYEPRNWGNLPVYDPGYAASEAYDVIRNVKTKSTSLKQDALLGSRIPEVPESVRAIIVELWSEHVLNPPIGD